jgi:hypothetical protein
MWLRNHYAHFGTFLLSILVFGEVIAAAQSDAATPTRFTVGGSFIISDPKEEFGRNVGTGYGGGGTVIYHLLRSGVLGARVDISGVIYDQESKTVPFSETVGARILVDVKTTNSITAFSVGPELAVPSGPIRPYVNIGYSTLWFRTTSSISGVDSSDEEIASTTNYKDRTNAWVYGGGLRVPLSGRVPLSLDVGVRYNRGGSTSYLREGSIQDNPDGSITIWPLKSRTPFLMYTIGVQYRIPHGPNPCSNLLC